MERDDLLKLFGDYLDGQLSADRVDELNGILATSAEARRLLLECVHQDVILRSLADEEVGVSPEAQSRGVPVRPTPARQRGRFRYALAAAVLLACGVAVWLVSRPGPPPPPPDRQATELAVAPTVEGLSGQVWSTAAGGRTPLRVGDRLEPGHEIRTDGNNSQAVVRLGPTCRVRIAPLSVAKITGPVSAPEVELFAGEVAAEVEPDGQRLLVRTSHATADVRAGRCRASYAVESTHVGMEGGTGRVTRTADGRAVDMKAGEYVVVTTGDRAISVQADPRQVTVPGWVVENELLVNGLAVGPGDGVILVADQNGPLARRRLSDGQLAGGPIREAVGATAVSFSPDGRTLVAGFSKGQLIPFAGNDWRSGPAIALGKRTVRQLTWDRDGRRLLATLGEVPAKPDESVLCEDLRPVARWPLAAARVTVATLHPDGQLLVGGTARGAVVEGSVAEPGEWVPRKTPAVSRPVTALAFSPDGTRLAVGTDGGTVHLFAWPAGTELATLRGHTGSVRAVAFHPTGAAIASGADDDTARLWDPRSGRELATLRGHRSSVLDLSFSANGSVLITGAREKRLCAWPLNDLIPDLGGKQ